MAPRVWIVGSSIIRRLHAHIREQHLDQNLGLRCKITWEGSGGRLWEQLLPELRSLRSRGPAPDILVIHLGGNSLCREGCKRRDLLRQMKADLEEVFRMFPRTRVLFSDILPRLSWRGQTGRTAYGVDRARRWLNGAISGFLSERQMLCVRHPNIGLPHLSRDGVHLSPEGNELLLSNIRESLQVELWR